MTRIVGPRDRDAFEPDPVQAYRRGRQLDAMLQAGRILPPRGVVRATHRILNEMDDLRALEAARRVKPPR